MNKIRVVLVEPEGAINVGFVARACLNFGVKELYLVNPKADLVEARRYAANAVSFLEQAVVVDSISEAVKDVDLTVATSAIGYSEGDHVRQAVSLRDFIENMLRGDEKIALLFGRESTGLTREELKKADVLITIPASPVYPTLNLSHAVVVVLYEFWMKYSYSLSRNVPPSAPREIIEEILSLVKNVLEKTGIHKSKIGRINHIIKSIVFRSRLSEYEARTLIYTLRKILRGLERTWN